MNKVKVKPLDKAKKPPESFSVSTYNQDQKTEKCTNNITFINDAFQREVTTEKDEPDLKTKIINVTYEWCSNSTSHGLPNIIRSRHILLKIMWFSCFLGSACYCCYQIYSLFNTYFSYPVLIDVKFMHETPAQFPAITICNLNSFNEVEGKQLIDSVIKKYHLDSEWNQTTSNRSSMNYTLHVLELAKIELQNTNIDDLERKKYGYKLEDMLISCSFSETPCSVDDFHWFFSYEYGNCYTFNYGIDENHKKNVKYMSKSGASFGLDIELYVGNKNGLQEYAYKSGIILVVHNYTMAPDLDDEGVHVSAGFDTHVDVKRELVHKLGKPYSNCVKNTSSFTELDSFEFRSQFNVTENNGYTERYCIKLCYQKYIEKSCSCSDASIPKIDVNLRRCQTSDEITCMLRKRTDFYTGHTFEECENVCLEECDTIKYSVVPSSAIYPTKWYAEFLKNDPVLNAHFMNFSYETIRDTFLKVNVFYDDLSYLLWNEVPEIRLETGIASLGGEFGLFIGISILSFVEIIELIFDILVVIYHHKFPSSSVTNKQT